MNTIETRPINQLVRNKFTPDRSPKIEHYVIPAYQRGYRWTTMHVKALLEDIDSFLKKQSAAGAVKESYCLQPIVVAPQIDEENNRVWEIIDGQQRLITLYIILKRLNKIKYNITFYKRLQSCSFLESIDSSHLDDNTPDTHFMSDAYRCIDKWFKKKEDEELGYEDSFANILFKQVQVIWYVVELKSNDNKTQESEKIDIFNRLNIGKIPLEDAELVRALLMSKTEGDTEREKLMRQAELSNEWFEIEHWLQKDEVWKFITNKKIANHIQLIFELISHNKNSENYNTYKWFEQQLLNSDNEIMKATELWRETKLIYNKFHSWFNNSELYHYVGFLLSTNLLKLEDLITKSKQNKSAFLKQIRDSIKEFIDNVDFDQLSYEKDQTLLKNVLLLFNVLSVLEINSMSNNKFPFNLYNSIKTGEKWSLEHIHAQQSQDCLQKATVIKEWLQDTYSSIEHINYIENIDNTEGEQHFDLGPIKEELREMMKQASINKDTFNNLKVRIIKLFDSESTKHLLDNMALLSCPDNSKLNNAIFPVKRDRIIQMEREGRFIPPCTRNVFLKLYSKADNQPFFWSKSDKIDYINEINRVFNNFKEKEL